MSLWSRLLRRSGGSEETLASLLDSEEHRLVQTPLPFISHHHNQAAVVAEDVVALLQELLDQHADPSHGFIANLIHGARLQPTLAHELVHTTDSLLDAANIPSNAPSRRRVRYLFNRIQQAAEDVRRMIPSSIRPIFSRQQLQTEAAMRDYVRRRDRTMSIAERARTVRNARTRHDIEADLSSMIAAQRRSQDVMNMLSQENERTLEALGSRHDDREYSGGRAGGPGATYTVTLNLTLGYRRESSKGLSLYNKYHTVVEQVVVPPNTTFSATDMFAAAVAQWERSKWSEESLVYTIQDIPSAIDDMQVVHTPGPGEDDTDENYGQDLNADIDVDEWNNMEEPAFAAPPSIVTNTVPVAAAIQQLRRSARIAQRNTEIQRAMAWQETIAARVASRRRKKTTEQLRRARFGRGVPTGGGIGVDTAPTESQVSAAYRYERTRLEDMPMFAGNGDIPIIETAEKKISILPQQCVFDYILYEYRTSSSSCRKKITRSELIAEFVEHTSYSGKGGVTTRDVIQWARAVKHVSVYSIDMLWSVFQHTISTDRAQIALFFVCNNMHCHPIIDTGKRTLISHTIAANQTTDKTIVPIVLEKEVHTWIDFQSAYIVDMPVSDITDKLHATDVYKQLWLLCQDVPDTATTIVLPVQTLDAILVMFVRTAGRIPTSLACKGSHVIAFRDPGTNMLYVAGTDWEARRSVMDAAHERYKLEDLRFNNQSWGAITALLFQCTQGAVKPCAYSPHAHHIFSSYPTLPYVLDTRSNPVGDEIETTIDIRRAYTAILQNNNTPWPVFDTLDVITPCKDVRSLPCGEVYIETDFHCCSTTMWFPAGWYPVCWAKYALECGYIQPDYITYAMCPRSQLEAEAFRPYTEFVEEHFPDNSKYLVNALVGLWGRSSYSTSVAGITTCADTAIATLQHLPNTAIHRVAKIEDLFIVTSTTKTDLLGGNIPWYRHVIASSWILLDSIIKEHTDETSRIVRINTDSVSIVNAVGIEKLATKDKCVFGHPYVSETVTAVQCNDDIVHDQLATAVYGPTLHQRMERRPPLFIYADHVKSPTIIMEKMPCPGTVCTSPDSTTVEQQKTAGAIVLGIAGSGKSHLLLQTYEATIDEDGTVCGAQHRTSKDPAVVTCYTHAACERLKKEGLPARVFDSVAYDSETKQLSAKGFYEYKHIVVDEFTMLPPSHINILVQIKLRQPGTSIVFAGDPSQCPPVTEGWVWYHLNPTIHWLCDWTIVQLAYKFTRYDKPMFNSLEVFRHTGKLIATWDRTECTEAELDICYSNKFRSERNAYRLSQWIKQTGKSDIVWKQLRPDFKVCIGLPIMGYHDTDTTLEVFKTRTFKIVDIKSESSEENSSSTSSLILQRTDVDDDTLLTIPQSFAATAMDYSFCVTTHKIQGITRRGHYNIWEADRMNRNVLYTALSRGTSLQYVHVVGASSTKLWDCAHPTTSHFLMLQPVPVVPALLYTVETTDTEPSTRQTLWTTESRDELEHRIASNGKQTIIQCTPFFFLQSQVTGDVHAARLTKSAVQHTKKQERKVDTTRRQYRISKYNIVHEPGQHRFVIRYRRTGEKTQFWGFVYSKYPDQHPTKEEAYFTAQQQQQHLRLNCG